MSTFRKCARTVTAAAVLTIGLACPGVVGAVPVFQITPSALGGPAAPVNADFISGLSSELLRLNSPAAGQLSTGAGETGWVQFTTFSLLGNPAFGAVTGLGVDYGLYLTFTVVSTLQSGTLALPGSTYTVDSLNFQVFADLDLDNVFTQASAAGAGTPALVVDGGAADDVLLATGSLLSGVASINAQGGAGINTLQTFLLTATGSTFFTSPVPFYSMAFDEFNNTAQGVSLIGNNLAINQATGGIDFVAVPEPGSLALLGAALVAFGFGRRRVKK